MARLNKQIVSLDNKWKKVEAARRKAYGAGMARGLKRAALLVQRESQKIVPVDTGTLINTAFTRADGRGENTSVVVGYKSNYAIYVHENLTARHAPGKEAKYLEKPARELLNNGTLKRVVKDEMGI